MSPKHEKTNLASPLDAPRRAASAPSEAWMGRSGLRRVDWVRLGVDHGVLRAEAVGVGFRLPAVRQIPVATAAAMIAAGIPSVTHRSDGTSAQNGSIGLGR
jgi:hypothetical protein